MMRHARLWAALLAVAAASVAPVLPGAAIPARAAAPAPVWTVQPGGRLGFQSSEGGAKFDGQFTRWRAAIRFDPKNLAGSSVQVKVDLASARTGSAERDEALPGEDWFAIGRFAQATFAATSFRDLGGGRYQAVGTLSLRGVTLPLTLPFLLRIQGDQARMEGATVVDRHAFGVGQGQFAAADTVPFAVRVTVALAAKRG